MTWEQLQLQHAKLQNECKKYEKYTKQTYQIEQQLIEIEKEIAQYDQQLEHVREIYEKLETRSILNYLRDFTGRREELLQENIEKIAQIELKLVEANLMKKDLQNDLEDTLQKKNEIDVENTEEALQQIRANMQVWLMVHAPDVSDKLTQLMDEEMLTKRLLVEIDEAIIAGIQAEESLRAAAEKIRDADAYSTWDLVGGGFIATALKHSALDESNSAVHEAQIALQRFKNELLDIQEIRHEDMYVKIDGLIQFTDYIFDDIFSDWAVHEKINVAQKQIVKAVDDVVGTIHDLRLKADVVIKKQEQLLSEKESIFLQGKI